MSQLVASAPQTQPIHTQAYLSQGLFTFSPVGNRWSLVQFEEESSTESRKEEFQARMRDTPDDAISFAFGRFEKTENNYFCLNCVGSLEAYCKNPFLAVWAPLQKEVWDYPVLTWCPDLQSARWTIARHVMTSRLPQAVKYPCALAIVYFWKEDKGSFKKMDEEPQRGDRSSVRREIMADMSIHTLS